MRVAVDYSWMGSTGIGRVASEVLKYKNDSVEIVPIRVGSSNAGIFTPLSLTQNLIALEADFFWSPGFMPPLLSSRMPAAITIHDLTHLHFYSKLHKIYFSEIIKRLLKNIQIIFTVSHFTKNEILKWSQIEESKVIVIPNGVDEQFSQIGEKAKFEYPYILYIGNRRGYKNIFRLMLGFSQSGLIEDGFFLALSGDRDSEMIDLERRAGIENKVYYLGKIPESSLPAVYRGAQALAFPSLYEGFGLPIVEAMACGTPVLTSNTSSMPEVAGGASLLVDPYSVREIADGLTLISKNTALREDLIGKGIERAKDYSWKITSEKYWSVIVNAVTDGA